MRMTLGVTIQKLRHNPAQMPSLVKICSSSSILSQEHSHWDYRQHFKESSKINDNEDKENIFWVHALMFRIYV